MNHELTPVMMIEDALLRKYDDVKIDGIFFSAFFGGHDDTWASAHDTYTLYKNFPDLSWSSLEQYKSWLLNIKYMKFCNFKRYYKDVLITDI